MSFFKLATNPVKLFIQALSKRQSMVCLLLVISFPSAGISSEVHSTSECNLWGDNAVNVLADYKIRVESQQASAKEDTKAMVAYSSFESTSTGKTYYDTIFPLIFSLADPEAVYAAGRDLCLSMPEGAFDAENFF